MLRRAIIALVHLLPALLTVAGEPEWPQRRGPDGNGIAVCGKRNPAALSGTPDIGWKAQVGSGYT